jgi:hypothetical protein
MPKFQQDFLKETVIPFAEDFLATPYETYEGERVAGMTPLQQQAMAGYGGLNVGGAEYGRAADIYGQLGEFQAPEARAARLAEAERMRGVGQVGDVTAGQLASADISRYMSPYTQNVIERSLQTLGGAQEMALGQQAAAAQRAGAFGGSRHGVAEAETRKAYGQQAADLVTKQLQQAFGQAQGAAQFDIGQRAQAQALNQQAAEAAAAREQAARSGNMAAANQFAVQQAQLEQQAGLANQQAALSAAGVRAQGAAGFGTTAGQRLQSQLSGLQAQLAAGEAARGLEQARLDVPYQDYVAGMQYPLTQFGVLTGAAGAIPSGYGTTTSTSQTGGLGPVLGAIGAAGQGLGAMGLTFSDAALKDNIQKVGNVNDINLYRWEWNDIAKAIGADKYPATGVIAQEVEAKYPQHVARDVTGFRLVDYAGLYSELEAI